MCSEVVRALRSREPYKKGRQELWEHLLLSAVGFVVLRYFPVVLNFYYEFLVNSISRVLVLNVLHLRDNSKSILLVTSVFQVKIIFCNLKVVGRNELWAWIQM